MSTEVSRETHDLRVLITGMNSGKDFLSSVTGTSPEIKEKTSHQVPVIDYEGSSYRQDFWERANRSYEDAIEREILVRLIPSKGHRIVELGAGFGRLGDLYLDYEQIILFDYSRSLLRDAVERWGNDPRFVFVAGNLYELPFEHGVFDTLVMVRVMHHLADVNLALSNIAATLHRNSVAVLEYANKRNMKAILRWLLRKQKWNPFHPDPIEFVDLNFDFHPHWMDSRLADAGFRVEQRLGASHFRISGVKERFSTSALIQLEAPLLKLSGLYPLSPSVFVQSGLKAGSHRAEVAEGSSPGSLFRCLRCETVPLRHHNDTLVVCENCGYSVMRRDGIWDFKSGSVGNSGAGM